MKVLNPYGGPVNPVPICKDCERKDKQIAELESGGIAQLMTDYAELKTKHETLLERLEEIYAEGHTSARWIPGLAEIIKEARDEKRNK